jgi:hypothetical protein
MFYITGDVHANIKDYLNRPFGRLKKNDAVIICGDFGVLWDGSDDEIKNIKRIGKKKYKTLFIDGAHENFDLLENYSVTQWSGGKVQVLSGNLMRLLRGQVYTINGKRIFTFGGGESVDKEMRSEHHSWWKQELPTAKEMDEGIENLTAHDWQVDYIFTHDAPSRFKRLTESEVSERNILNVYLDTILERCKYSKWVFGAYHKNKQFSKSIEMVFDGVIKLG